MNSNLQYPVEEWRFPEVTESDEILFKEYGRCFDGVTYEAFYFAFVRDGSLVRLYVKHGGGKETIYQSYSMGDMLFEILKKLDSDERFQIFFNIYSTFNEARNNAIECTKQKYHRAFYDGRLKKRKCKQFTKIWIEGE